MKATHESISKSKNIVICASHSFNISYKSVVKGKVYS